MSTQHVRVRGYRGIAWAVVDSSKKPWSVVMVGDDRVFEFDPEECEPLEEDEFCPSCGQIGCGHR